MAFSSISNHPSSTRPERRFRLNVSGIDLSVMHENEDSIIKNHSNPMVFVFCLGGSPLQGVFTLFWVFIWGGFLSFSFFGLFLLLLLSLLSAFQFVICIFELIEAR